DNDVIPDMLFAASTGLRAFDEPNLSASGRLVDELLTELIELRVANQLQIEDKLDHQYLSAILRLKIAKALKSPEHTNELLVSSFQKHVKDGDLATWADSLLATGVLRSNPLVPRLMIQ